MTQTLMLIAATLALWSSGLCAGLWLSRYGSTVWENVLSQLAHLRTTGTRPYPNLPPRLEAELPPEMVEAWSQLETQLTTLYGDIATAMAPVVTSYTSSLELFLVKVREILLPLALAGISDSSSSTPTRGNAREGATGATPTNRDSIPRTGSQSRTPPVSGPAGERPPDSGGVIRTG